MFENLERLEISELERRDIIPFWQQKTKALIICALRSSDMKKCRFSHDTAHFSHRIVCIF